MLPPVLGRRYHAFLLLTFGWAPIHAFDLQSPRDLPRQLFQPMTRGSQNGSSRLFAVTGSDDSDKTGKGYSNGDSAATQGSNEWGIPDSKTLVPFGDTPKEQLENGAHVTLLGSGPGDPDLLTVKAFQLLQDPDALVICDRLVSQEILDLVKGEVKVARKLPGCAELAQEEIYWWAYQGLAQGKHVIRLKIGDPFVFGRGGEEVLTFRRFGVESKVVPVSLDSFVACLICSDARHILIVHLGLVRFFSPLKTIRGSLRHSRHRYLAISRLRTEVFPIKLSCALDMGGRAPPRI